MAKLIDAMHILCGENISPNKIQEADNLLRSFVNEFESLYGEHKMVFNVHLLLHLADCVRNLGPLHMYSNYHFEDHIGHLVSLHKGTTDVADQICEKYLLEKNMFHHLSRSPMAQKFYDDINCKHKFKNARKIARHVLLGKPTKSKISENEKALIAIQLNIPYDFKLEEYDAVLLNSQFFYESISKLDKHTSDSFIFNSESKRFAQIDSIFVVDNNLHILINEKFELKVDASYKCKSNIPLKELTSNRKTVLSPLNVGPKYAFVKFENSITCSKFPNMIERN